MQFGKLAAMVITRREPSQQRPLLVGSGRCIEIGPDDPFIDLDGGVVLFHDSICIGILPYIHITREKHLRATGFFCRRRFAPASAAESHGRTPHRTGHDAARPDGRPMPQRTGTRSAANRQKMKYGVSGPRNRPPRQEASSDALTCCAKIAMRC